MLVASGNPTASPTSSPLLVPSALPTSDPSRSPSLIPSTHPTFIPTTSPSASLLLFIYSHQSSHTIVRSIRKSNTSAIHKHTIHFPHNSTNTIHKLYNHPTIQLHFLFGKLRNCNRNVTRLSHHYCQQRFNRWQCAHVGQVQRHLEKPRLHSTI